jgi:LAS superfamily LD-carboxypeptidase LdcB
MTSLNPFELTGRASTHVHEAPLLDARLHAEVIAPAQALREASAAAGIDLVIVSSFRDFTRQAAIWNGKFQGRRPLLDAAGAALEAATLSPAERVRAILIWSALPGASRHHWGTDFDVIDRAALPPGYQVQLTVEEFTDGGPFARLNEWLGANLGNFGFFRPYTTDRGGVRPEPWHLSYAPVAVPALAAFTPEILREAIERAELDGKEEILKKLPELYDKYVASVDAP